MLLVGDGHYDFTGVSGTSLPNLLPPYLIDIDPWIGETAADNRYVSVDGPDDYLPDMHIGRIPARTVADVTAAVEKIMVYETTSPAGEWQRRAVFVADDCADPAADFHALSDDVRSGWLPAGYITDTIYYAASKAACPEATHTTGGDVRAAIKAAFNNDALMVQWVGHGSKFRWGSISLFNNDDPWVLAANAQWPISFHYTCWTGYFVNLQYNEQSLGETLLVAPGRGSVADVSPTGLQLGNSLLVLNRGIAKAIFQDRIDRLGEALDEGKLYYYGQAPANPQVIDTMILFGDPALRLRLPTLSAAPVFLPLLQAAPTSPGQ